MGVSGTVGVLKNHRNVWSRSYILRDTSLVIDVTKGWYWYLNKGRNLPFNLSSQTSFGCDMIQLGHLYRNLFTRLLQRNVKPILIYDGTRLNESTHGDLASKRNFLEHSCQGALNELGRRNFPRLTELPELATNVLKEIANELKIEAHQCIHEVHPVLLKWATLTKGPVMTSHSDFIFTNAPFGHIWFEELNIPTDDKSPINCNLYEHERMLADKRIPNCGPALKGLYVLLRDDFSFAYSGPVNEVLRLTGTNLAIRGWDRKKTVRLERILNNWPRNLQTLDDVRQALANAVPQNERMMRDYDSILESFSETGDLSSPEARRQFNLVQMDDLQQALTQREACADFALALAQTNFDRTNIEDIQTFRSTYSLRDRAKEYMLAHLGGKMLPIMDRTHSRFGGRSLFPLTRTQPPRLDRDSLYGLFHFTHKELTLISSIFVEANFLPREASMVYRWQAADDMALMLLLARFGYKLAFNSNYDNTDRPANEGAPEYCEPRQMRKFFTALIGSFVYISRVNGNPEDSSRLPPEERSEMPADFRVAVQYVYTNFARNARTKSASDERDYFKARHSVEMLNSVMHVYQELNSLFNYPAQRLRPSECYSGQLIYNIMRGWSNNVSGYLSPLLSEQLFLLLSTGVAQPRAN